MRFSSRSLSISSNLPPNLDDPRLAVFSDLGIDFSLLGANFELPIKWTGHVEIDATTYNSYFEGAAELTAPFSLTVDPLAVSIAEDDEGERQYMVKFGLGTSFADILRSQVQSRVPGALWQLFDSTAMPFIELFDASDVIVANNEDSDPDLGDYVDGVTVFTQFPIHTTEPLRSLHRLFPALGLDRRAVVLSLALKNGPEGDFVLGFELTLDQDLLTPAVVFRKVGLSLDKSTEELNAGVEVEFELRLGGEVLELSGGLQGQIGSDSSTTVWGALGVNDGAWEEPFGVPGITITGLGAELSAIPEAPHIAIGLRGGVKLGSSFLDAEIGVLFDPGNPDNCLLDIVSEQGIDLPKLISGLTGDNIPVQLIPDVAITDLNIRVAPSGGSIAGQEYDEGLALSGKIDLWGYRAEVAGELSYESGGSLSGAFDPIVIRAGNFTIFELQDSDRDGGATISIDIDEENPGGQIDGTVVVLGGLYAQNIRGEVSTEKLEVELTGSNMGIYTDGSLSLSRDSFDLLAKPRIGVSVSFNGVPLGISVGCDLSVSASHQHFSQTITFKTTIITEEFLFGPVTIDVPLLSPEDLGREFLKLFTGTGLGKFVDALVDMGRAAIEWVAGLLGSVVEDVVAFFVDIGADVAVIATKVVDFFSEPAGKVVGMLGVGVDAAVDLLSNTFNYGAEQLGIFMRDVYNFGGQAATQVLKGLEYGIDVISDVLGSAYNLAEAGIVKILKVAGYGFDQLSSLARNTLRLGSEAFAKVMAGAGYAAKKVGAFLKDSYKSLHTTVVACLHGAGYFAVEVAGVLKDVYSYGLDQACSLLRYAGYGFNTIAVGLKNIYNGSAQAIAKAVARLDAGIRDVIAAIGSAFKTSAEFLASTLRSVGSWTVEVVAGVMSEVYQGATAVVTGALKGAGYAVTAVAGAVSSVYNMGADAVTEIFESVGYAVEETGKALAQVFNQTSTAVAKTLMGVYETLEIGRGLKKLYNGTLKSTLEILKGANFSIGIMGSVAKGVFNASKEAFGKVAFELGYVADKVADTLRSTYRVGIEAATAVLDGVGFVMESIADGLAKGYDVAYKAVTAALRTISDSIEDIGNAVKEVFSLEPEELKDALAHAGFLGDEIGTYFGKLGGAFETLGGTLVGGGEMIYEGGKYIVKGGVEIAENLGDALDPRGWF